MKENFNTKKIISEVNQAFDSFCEAYLQQRDLNAISSFFSENITNIGSANDELTLDYASVVDIFRRDIAQCPEKIEQIEHSRNVIPVGPLAALFISTFDNVTTINGIPLYLKGYRQTIYWQKFAEQWKITHIHYSRGESELQEGESFPLARVEAQNRELEKLVNKRTHELHELNNVLAEANKDLVEAKERFQSIFEKVSDGIIVADWQNKSLFMVNKTMCRILGYKRKELEKLWITHLIPEETRTQCTGKILQECNGDIIIADDIPLICKNGEIRYFDISSQPIKIDRSNYMVSVYRDTTDYKNALETQKDIEIAQKASEAKNLFLANMSHEIRTPVTGIIGMSEILSQTHLDAHQKEYLQIINESSKVLLTLINDILDITKIEAGKLVLRPEPLNIREMTDNIATLCNPCLISKNNRLQIEITPDIPEIIVVDKIRLEQIVMNLINNAIKFTLNGNIGIRISIPDNKNRQNIKVEVSDTGIGISTADQHKLFRKFQQVDNSYSRPADGSGLGLYICKQLVSHMGGTIEVESEPGKGSRFWFTFQVKEASAEDLIMKHQKKHPKQHDTLGLNILLVDDKKVNLKVISLMLNAAKCKVDTAENGLEALDKYQPNVHNIILLDIMMPVMDGVSAMKEFRSRHHQLPPIVAISANAMTGEGQKYIEMGFDGYITKPVTLEKLVSEIKSIN